MSRFIRLPLQSFALRSAVQLQSESAPWLSSGFSAISRRGSRDPSLGFPTRFTLRRRSSDHFRGLTASTASNRYSPTAGLRVGTCRVATQYMDARISFCGYRRGNPAFFRTRVGGIGGIAREWRMCTHIRGSLAMNNGVQRGGRENPDGCRWLIIRWD